MNTATRDDYLKKLIESWKKEISPVRTISWLDQLRTNAVNRAESLRFPTLRDEEWRFTDITPLRNASFPRAAVASSLSASDLAPVIPDETACRVVFIDGQYIPELSGITDGSPVTVSSLSGLTGEHVSTVTQHLGRLADFQDDVFVALNTALMQDGVCIMIPAGVAVDIPVYILYATSQKEVSTYPRCLLIAETGARVTVVEEYVTLHEAASLTNTVTEIYIEDLACVDHVRVQRESSQAFHVANTTVFVGSAACYHATSFALGAHISRYDQNITLAGEHSECMVDGLTLIAGHQLADTHTFIDHAKPYGKSRQLHKCIVDDNARGVFSGKIMVRPHAQLIDARQLNRNLLLSERARMDTKPQLEIFADDVKCAHGATVGQLDKEALFYLRSRGLSETAARNLLTYAFGGEVINRVSVTSLRQRLEEYVLASTGSIEL